MAKSPAAATEAPQESSPSTVTVMILAPNVWTSECKMFQHDVVEVSASDADILIENGQAKATKDDVTHCVVEGARVEV